MDIEFLQMVFLRLLDGLWVTVLLVATSLVIGNCLAVPVALARVSDRMILKAPAYGYILFIRGTPLLVQMFMIYYGLAQFAFVRDSIFWPILRDPVNCAIIALSISTAAYSGEILRGAIQNVPRGLTEAAASVGLRKGQTMRLVTLPIALRYCLPSLSNETILLLKASAISFTITVQDVMGQANIIRARTFHTYEPLLTAALFYLALTFILVRGFKWLEARLSNEIRREESTSEKLTAELR